MKNMLPKLIETAKSPKIMQDIFVKIRVKFLTCTLIRGLRSAIFQKVPTNHKRLTHTENLSVSMQP
jgi:hypothetical protein